MSYKTFLCLSSLILSKLILPAGLSLLSWIYTRCMAEYPARVLLYVNLYFLIFSSLQDCRCCRESTLEERLVSLHKCYGPDGLEPPVYGEHMNMYIKEPADCECFTCTHWETWTSMLQLLWCLCTSHKYGPIYCAVNSYEMMSLNPYYLSPTLPLQKVFCFFLPLHKSKSKAIRKFYVMSLLVTWHLCVPAHVFWAIHLEVVLTSFTNGSNEQ